MCTKKKNFVQKLHLHFLYVNVQQQNHGSGNNKGMAIELHNTTTTAAGSQRHGSAKHAALQ